MGTIATARVITRAERTSRPSLVQPGNREWVTAIETINAAGWVLPLMVIFAGKTHRIGERKHRFTSSKPKVTSKK